MNFIIEDGQFSFSVDWSKLNTIEGGWENEYFPSAKESIEAFMRLLENVYPQKAISDALAEGLDAMDYSEQGWKARERLQEVKEDK